MIVRLVTEGNFLLSLFGESLVVGMSAHRSSWAKGISRLFHMAAPLYYITHKPSKIGMAQSQAGRGRGSIT